ncbi:MAG: FAD-binding protein, partial [Actinomycetota bacterium]|nr:FAD-binding protein [Actinomycetota bacterium]
MSVITPMVSPAAHAKAVADLVRRYRQLPPGTPVRLGKRSSHLFRFDTTRQHGLPHESVREMDILTGSGDVITARPDDEMSADLFHGFPNSYGALGYA